MTKCRIINANCRNSEAWQGLDTDMVFTSPPYLGERDYESGLAAQSLDDWTEMMIDCFLKVPVDAERGRLIFVNLAPKHRNGYFEYYRIWLEAMKDMGWTYVTKYIWDKGRG